MSIQIIKNRTIVYLLIIVSLLCAKSAQASLKITEVMYDPVGSNAGHQWVEIYNDSSESFEVDALKWRINDGSSHYINDKVNFTIPANSFFILTGDKNTFLSDHAGHSGLVVDTVLSLDKDGDTVSLINDSTTVDSFTYTSSMGAAEDGNSLQKIGSNWKTGIPTPNGENQESAPNTDNNDDDDNNDDTNTTNTTTTTSSSKTNSGNVSEKIVNTKLVNPKTTTEIIARATVPSGIAFEIKSETLVGKELITSGKFIWNFGDGVTKQELVPGKSSHTYFYPGEYVMTLSYFDTVFDTEPKATDRLIVKVIDTTVIINSVGTIADPYVEIKNTSNNEMDISTWILKGVNHTFSFPKGTTLLGNHSLKISPRHTFFDGVDVSNLVLVKPTGELIAKYPDYSMKEEEVKKEVKTLPKIKSVSDVSSDEIVVIPTEEFPKIVPDTTVKDLNNLSANASDSLSSKAVNNKQIAYTGLVVLLISAFATLFINKKKKIEKENVTESDFKIME